jgi:hypothetical protein
MKVCVHGCPNRLSRPRREPADATQRRSGGAGSRSVGFLHLPIDSPAGREGSSSHPDTVVGPHVRLRHGRFLKHFVSLISDDAFRAILATTTSTAIRLCHGIKKSRCASKAPSPVQVVLEKARGACSSQTLNQKLLCISSVRDTIPSKSWGCSRSWPMSIPSGRKQLIRTIYSNFVRSWKVKSHLCVATDSTRRLGS